MNAIFCSKCGSENIKDANFCVQCGEKIKIASQEKNLEMTKKSFWDMRIAQNPNLVILFGLIALMYNLYLGICMVFGTLANRYAKKNWVIGLLFLIPVFIPILKMSSSFAQRGVEDPLVYGLAPAGAITAYLVAMLGEKLDRRRNVKTFLILVGAFLLFALFYSAVLSLDA